ncbi:hypothetical protein DFJ74DRAFT_707009 [Hyaloraphidium curvatum]|nr:hypothetical protein DFJ74DRAFT_707009 [Hyaloraphidium curvatum]
MKKATGVFLRGDVHADAPHKVAELHRAENEVMRTFIAAVDLVARFDDNTVRIDPTTEKAISQWSVTKEFRRLLDQLRKEHPNGLSYDDMQKLLANGTNRAFITWLSDF